MILRADRDKPHRCPWCWSIPDAIYDGAGRAETDVVYTCAKCATRWCMFSLDRFIAQKRAERVWLWRMLNGQPRPFAVRCERGWTYMVHRNTWDDRATCPWRVTRFDETMDPVGHGEFRTFADAMRDAQTDAGGLSFAHLLT